ncbi:hypothetical protein GCK72_006380 [Caenorhabditis remanei]|uniref:VWFA domain-containing protein n=1 Tax=Caenorhabditis remanei TaxID=31234 RepID=A0A6A5HJ78_CAERE|nr:hypothetical protein GCK72_006380 [Caenorhabditis remanei]KAF1766423.1 hypothetical protein GCK72_006380 [Caenorhabditis remanei]
MRVLTVLLLFLLATTSFQSINPVISPVQLFCPTVGTNAYALVTVTEGLSQIDFEGILESYAKFMPFNSTQQIKYDFYFGTNYSTIVTTNDLALEIEVAKDNQQDTTVYLKKQVVLMTDYVPINVTNVFNKNTNENTQRLGIMFALDLTPLDNAAEFPVFKTDEENVGGTRAIFQETRDFEKPLSDVYVFMTSANMSQLMQVIENTIGGPTCQLSPTKMYSTFIHTQLVQNDTVWELVIPWLGQKTHNFASNCMKALGHFKTKKNCTMSKEQVVNDFVQLIHMANNQTFAYLFLDDTSCATTENLTTTIQDSTHIRIVVEDGLNDVYEDFTLPLVNLGFLDKTVDNQVIYNNIFYLQNFSTSCTDEIPMGLAVQYIMYSL